MIESIELRILMMVIKINFLGKRSDPIQMTYMSIIYSSSNSYLLMAYYMPHSTEAKHSKQKSEMVSWSQGIHTLARRWMLSELTSPQTQEHKS